MILQEKGNALDDQFSNINEQLDDAKDSESELEDEINPIKQVKSLFNKLRMYKYKGRYGDTATSLLERGYQQATMMLKK